MRLVAFLHSFLTLFPAFVLARNKLINHAGGPRNRIAIRFLRRLSVSAETNDITVGLWMNLQEYTTQYIVALSGAPPDVNSTLKTTFFLRFGGVHLPHITNLKGKIQKA